MIRELHLRQKPQNNHARILFFVFFALTFILFGVSYAMTQYRGLLQLASVLCFVTAVLVYTKYIAAIYYYEILPDSDERPVFVVRQQTGKRSTTLCRIDLSDVQSVDKLSREEYKAHKTPSHMRKYVYTPSLFPATVYLLTAVGRYETAEIVLEGNDEFAELLRAQAAEARELFPRYEDEE